MSKLKIMKYVPANGGDYASYTLSDGQKYYLWLKASFEGGEAALVHVITGDDIEVGTVTLYKDLGTSKDGSKLSGELKMFLNSKAVETIITFDQYMRPNKKYIFDKIINGFFL